MGAIDPDVGKRAALLSSDTCVGQFRGRGGPNFPVNPYPLNRLIDFDA